MEEPMANTDIDPFLGLGEDDDLGASTAPPPRQRQMYPCEQCGGTGRWSGGRNQYGSRHCFACNGKGEFAMSHGDRMRARSARAQRKQRNTEKAKVSFTDQHPTLIDQLRGMQSWNSFAASLVGQFEERGRLSDKQVASAERMITKLAKRAAERLQQQQRDSVVVDLQPIRQMFETAAASGLRRPIYRAEGLVISLAGPQSRNAGALYVKLDGGRFSQSDIQGGDPSAYQGKVGFDNRFLPARGADPETAEALQRIAQDPREASVRYGRLTGSCGCCGRELTDPNSVAAGIGPICASKWGL